MRSLASVTLCVCPLSKRKTTFANDTKLGRHTVHGSRSACVESEVKRSKVTWLSDTLAALVCRLHYMCSPIWLLWYSWKWTTKYIKINIITRSIHYFSFFNENDKRRSKNTPTLYLPILLGHAHPQCKWTIGRVSYIRIYLCYFCFRWKTVSLVQVSLQYLMHHVTVSLQQSKITLQNNCINNTSITQPTLSFYFWLKM